MFQWFVCHLKHRLPRVSARAIAESTKDQQLKNIQEVKERGLPMDWWVTLKLELSFKKDKIMSFYEEKVQVDDLCTDKIIQKKYTFYYNTI